MLDRKLTRRRGPITTKPRSHVVQAGRVCDAPDLLIEHSARELDGTRAGRPE